MKANTHFKLITLLERNEHLLSRGKKNPYFEKKLIVIKSVILTSFNIKDFYIFTF